MRPGQTFSGKTLCTKCRAILRTTHQQKLDAGTLLWNSATVTEFPILRPQEIPLDDPQSCEMFTPSTEKPFVATPAAIEMYGHETILACLSVLQEAAVREAGLDYLQVFESSDKQEKLWFIEDGSGGAITALLPSDY